MKKRFIVLIEDDFEVKGNGLGDVADLQYLPGLALMNIAKKHDVKLTFMVDVAHQLTMTKYKHQRGVKIQKELWDQTVKLMKERGFDVQLHLHPQWLNAEYKDGFFFLSDDWNLGCYSAEQQELLISASTRYLKDLLQPDFPDYDICAFKAGAWGLQPSSNTLLTALKTHGIKIIMGVRDGLTIPGISVNYQNLEEKYLPYYPDLDDVTRKSTSETGILMLPLQPYEPNLITFSKLLLDRAKNKLRIPAAMKYQYDSPVPEAICKLDPLTGQGKFRISLRPYSTHLKIGNQPFSYLKDSFDAVINRLRPFEDERIPIVIESHTKQYHGYYEHVDRFLGYINEKYNDEVEFGDMISYSKELGGIKHARDAIEN